MVRTEQKQEARNFNIMKKEPAQKVPQKKNQPKQVQQSKKKAGDKKFYDYLGFAAIFILGIIAYSNSFKCPFNFDDFNTIVNNNSAHDLSNVKAWWGFSTNRPLSIFTFVLNYHFNQLDVWYYHLVNLMVHLANACLVWWLIMLIFSTPVLRDNPISRHRKVLAFFAAILFVTHPLATQSVTYIVQRMSALAALFYFLSLALYVKGRLFEKENKIKYLFFAASFISAVLGVFTKENAITLPFMIIVFEIFFLQTKRPSINFKDYRVLLLIFAFLGIIAIIPLKLSFNVFKPIQPSFGNDFVITPLNYFYTQFTVILKYIQLLILPVHQNLDYDFRISNSFFELRTILSFIAVLAILVFAVFLFKKNRIVSFGIFWFFITISIESSFIPINDLIYEHRTYLPSFGFFLIVVTVIYQFLWKKNKNMAVAIFVVLALVYTVFTYQRNKVWKSELSLWTDVISKSPNKARAVNNRGFLFLKLQQYDKAVIDFTKAIELHPKWAVTYYNRGVAYEKLGALDKAMADYTTAISYDSKYSDAYYNRGLIFGNHGQMNEAISDFSKSIESQPYNNSKAYYNRGVTYAATQQWLKSIDDFTVVINEDGKNAKAYSNRGVAYANLKQWDKAIEDYTKAIEIEPNFGSTYNNRGNAYLNLGQYDKALADYTNAAEIDPGLSDAVNNRNIVLQKINSGYKQ